MQKKANRLITNSSFRAHTEPLFKKLQILSFPKLIEQAKLLFMHSIHYDYAPRAFSNIWLTNKSRNLPLNLRNADQYIVPRCKTSSFNKYPLYTFPVSWNAAGPSKYHSTRITFKIALKMTF